MNETAIAIIFSMDRKSVLLVKRRDVPVWVLPGGGIDLNEPPHQAAVREAEEETGYSVRIKRQVGLYLPINRLAKKTHLFECEIENGMPTLSSECQSIKFFPVSHLPKLLPPPHDEWIHEAYANHTYLIMRPLTSVNYHTLFKQFFCHPLLVMRFLLTKIGLTINT